MFKNIIEWIISVFTKPPVVPPVPVPPSGNFVTDLLNLHNSHRQSLGLKPLKLNVTLNQAAQNHSNWMKQNNVLSHEENGVTVGARLTKLGYNWSACGENIAQDSANANAVFQLWLNSPGHKQNIESTLYLDVGFGLAGAYWTTDFGHQK